MDMSRKSSHTSRKPGRKPLTRDMLLPLPVAKVRAMSLEHHLALAAMHSGRGSVEQMNVLLKVTYLTYFMADAAHESVDLDLFRAAETAFECCGLRGHRDGNWTLPTADHDVLARILALHDRQLGSMPSWRYTEAWARIHAFLRSDAQSPLPAPACA
ncbi:hypothetical protein R69658_08168 [Paraburkholderia aspalathi]|uniref:Fis family transcriptional regulator n=3 Tax=Paraburkholderia aspalathi TaxID=1324617 RepID=A0ABN7NIP0_9BURK|nr:hypothetical protein R69746_07528 [Paraburkholderia aspalathi]CAE6871326.1 hypothetical protein R69658_08168 [Paraburkholderia aspalathi]CAE6875935.1 hypothetical protein R75465_08609 [Paraburkholderia aspalathi]